MEKKLTEFQQRVFEVVKQVPIGKVTTYKQIAIKLGTLGGARAVGNALHNNTKPIQIPCHRVLNCKGELAKNFVFGGKEIQRQWLEKEGIILTNDKVDLAKYIWQ